MYLIGPHTLNGYFYSDYTLSEWSGFGILVLTKGFWYYIETAYRVGLSAVTIILCVKAYRKAWGIRKRQAIILLTLSIIGALFAASSLFGGTTSKIDYVPLLLGGASVLLFVTLFKYELFDLVPLAYSRLFDALDQPIMILTDAMMVIRANPVAKRVFSRELGEEIHVPLCRVLCDNTQGITALKRSETYSFIKTGPEGDRHYSVRLIRLSAPNGKPGKDYGYLLVFTDVTSHISQVHSLRIAAAIDPLTGLFNRRHFYALAERALKQAKKEGRSVALIMLDIDHFKEINDAYGHPAGDYVLQEISSVIRGHLREDDILARYGGEEFVILMPSVGIQTAEMGRATDMYGGA